MPFTVRYACARAVSWLANQRLLPFRYRNVDLDFLIREIRRT